MAKPKSAASLSRRVRWTCSSRFARTFSIRGLFHASFGFSTRGRPHPHPYPLSQWERGAKVRALLAWDTIGVGLISPVKPSPLSPLPVGEGRKGEGASSVGHYRGGFDFSGLMERARELRKKQTPAEDLLWE